MATSPSESGPPRRLELLAPAGDRACLEAALEAGADSVYLGLTTLNARRKARNFSEAELADAVGFAHGLGRRVYLALNIDLAQDELPAAARMLEVASRLRLDAVLVRDPALLALKPHFPELEYHLSTQGCIASSADVEAARELGATRVVLARELTLAEIAAASRVDGVETEVFAEGALCFAVSGRCLLSSWVGGRSANRGQCTSPCRVPWSLDGRPAGTPLSPHDLSLAGRVEELRAAGARALKIEGRMKNPSWVRSAVGLLRRAIDGAAPPESLAREAERRGGGGRRKVTSAFLDGRFAELTELEQAAGPREGADAGAPQPQELPVRSEVALLLRQLDTAVGPESGPSPDRARLDADQALALLGQLRPAGGAIVEGLDAPRLERIVAAYPSQPLIAALPSVFFEEDRRGLEALVLAASRLQVPIEANSWGGWLLARRAGARLVAGPGLGILNSLAAQELAARGFEEATASIEADALKLDALLCRTQLPCSVVVYGRPALMITRVELPAPVATAELEDRRAAKLRARRHGALWELRPVHPFNVRGRQLPARAAHVVVDLVGSADPLAEWERGNATATRFNFDRALG